MKRVRKDGAKNTKPNFLITHREVQNRIVQDERGAHVLNLADDVDADAVIELGDRE